MKYYDPDRDSIVNGYQFTVQMLAFLRDVTRRDEPENRGLYLSPEGLSGLSDLYSMMGDCLEQISPKLLNSEDA